MEYIIIIISAVFVNNILLSQFLGICPFLGVSNKVSTAVGMSGAVCFVMALSTLVTYLLQYYVLNPLNIGFMQTIVFILVIAALVLSGIGHISSAHYNQLCSTRSCNPGCYQRVYIWWRTCNAQSGRVCGLCCGKCIGLWSGNDPHGRNQGTAGTCKGSRGFSRRSDCTYNCRNHGYGLYGLLRYCITGPACYGKKTGDIGNNDRSADRGPAQGRAS